MKGAESGSRSGYVPSAQPHITRDYQGGTPSLIKGTHKDRACPECKARPGESCQRWIKDAGMWRKIKGYHPARKIPAAETL